MNRRPTPSRTAVLAGAVLIISAVAVTVRPAPPQGFGVDLLAPLSLAGTRSLSVGPLLAQVVTLRVNDADFPDRGLLSPVANLDCQNLDTGENGQVTMTPIAVSSSPRGRLMELMLTEASIMGLPYPIDPVSFEGKPAAIIAQKTGHSLFSLDQATLRQQFADISQYMLLTADHHYQMPLGDGQLKCQFDVELREAGNRPAVASAASSHFVLNFGRGLPANTYVRDRSIPNLRGWPTWVVNPSANALLVGPPPGSATTPGELAELQTLQGRRTPERIASIRRWDDGSAVSPWVEILLDASVVDAFTSHVSDPPRIARALGLVSVAMYDATVVGARARSTFQRPAPCSLEPRLEPVGGCSDFSYPSEHAVVAGAASAVLAYLYPAQADRFRTLAEDAATSRLWAGTNYRSDVESGLALGRRVGQQIIARGESDGSAGTWSGSIPQGSSYWVPTPPGFQTAPMEPLAGAWQPWNLTSGSQFRPGPPPRPGSPQFEADLREVYNLSRPLSIEHQEIASFWEDKLGSFSPPGHWNLIALQLVRSRGLSTPDAALVFATLNTGQADAFIACWDAKFTYWSVRPVTAIRRELDAGWSPYIFTPPFPSYVSGHGTASGAASQILAHFFPDDAAQLRAWAEEAALSRLYGGIHYRTDNEVGLRLGREVGAAALMKIHSIAWKGR